jgi:hypothetical protein
MGHGVELGTGTGLNFEFARHGVEFAWSLPLGGVCRWVEGDGDWHGWSWAWVWGGVCHWVMGWVEVGVGMKVAWGE